jgi:hypothetical protein
VLRISNTQCKNYIGKGAIMKKLGIVAIFIFVAGLLWSAEPNIMNGKIFLPGKEVRVTDGGRDIGSGCFMVYVPTDYNDSRNWPVIFYYHGAGETLSTQRFQTATGSKGFIIVAMEFVPPQYETMTQSQYLIHLKREQRSLEAARLYVSNRLKIDHEMMILAGVSKGGWLVGNMVDLNASPWAAVAIFCAGRQCVIPLSEGSVVRNKNIYIGTGQSDQNLKAAKQAADDYRRRHAIVTLDIYPGLGHAVDPNSPALRKWFIDAAKGSKKLEHISSTR